MNKENKRDSLCIQHMEKTPVKQVKNRMVYCKQLEDHQYGAYRFYKPITTIAFIVLLLIQALPVKAQNNDDLIHPFFVAKEDGFSYRSLIKLLDMDSVYIGSKLESSYHDLLSVMYSRFGRYKEARHEAEATGTMFLDQKRFAHNFKDAKAIPLSEVMDSIIENHQGIMMNELHFNPHSRAFVISWLEKCYQNGYRYLAAETLRASDSLLNQRRTVLLGETGFYSDEPVFADLFRTALNMGYTLVSYEGSGSGVDREVNQAKNLVENILDKDPEAKFLLLGGFGHISDRNGWYAMGRYFKEQSGIDPFTMDCAMYFDDPYWETDSLLTAYYDLIDTMPVREPILFYDTVNHVYINLSGMDATCCLPRTRFIEDNIPDWKLYNGKVLFTLDRRFIDENGFPEGCVSAFLKSEGEQCVPIDQYMYGKDEKEFKLALYKGEYLLRFDDGKEYRYVTVTVK